MSGKTKSTEPAFSRNSHSVEQETLVEKETMSVKKQMAAGEED